MRKHEYPLWIAGQLLVPLGFLLFSEEGQTWISGTWWWGSVSVLGVAYFTLCSGYVYESTKAAVVNARSLWQLLWNKSSVAAAWNQVTAAVLWRHLRPFCVLAATYFIVGFAIWSIANNYNSIAPVGTVDTEIIMAALSTKLKTYGVLAVLFGLLSVSFLVLALSASQHLRAHSEELDISYTLGAIGHSYAFENQSNELLALDIQGVEIVNRSNRNVSLTFTIMVKHPSENRYIDRIEGAWKSEFFSADPADPFLNVPSESTVVGILIFTRPSFRGDKDFPDHWEHTIDWENDVTNEMFELVIADKISGKSLQIPAHRSFKVTAG
jgi:hypothetical protein